MERGRLTAVTIPARKVSEGLEEELFALFDRHYDAVSREAFSRDLREKDWVVLLRDGASTEVKGFSTLQLIHVRVDGIPIAAAFSGDTIVDRAYWGEQELVKGWYALMEGLRRKLWPIPLYWFLISKGYRTYLYLPIFFREFHPRHDRETPPFKARLIEALGRHKYPEQFNAETGVIEFEATEGRLKEDLAGVPPHRRTDPNVAFFLQRNPGYRKGNELVCVAEFAPENFNPFGLRLVMDRKASLVS